jgi:putative RNA 2'-phosphotransferase
MNLSFRAFLETDGARQSHPMDKSLLISTSKFLSLILRHKPETIGLELDKHGWVEIDKLLSAAKQFGKNISHSLLLQIVKEDNKKRFAISPDGLKIRASQGHSIDVDLGLRPVDPPEELFHGTAKQFLDSIMKKGLLPGNRQYVHLSPDRETATAVGQRRGKPVILKILAAKMRADNHLFFLSENGVWLTKHVPPEYIEFA